MARSWLLAGLVLLQAWPAGAQAFCRPGPPRPAPYVNDLLECRTERLLLPPEPPPPPPPPEPPLPRKIQLQLWQSLPQLQSVPLQVTGILVPHANVGWCVAVRAATTPAR